MKALKKILTGLSIVALCICCGAVLLSNVSAFGWKALAVPTGSMRPTITPGSMVFVHRVPISSLKVGDIITYINPLEPKSTLSHRIVKTYYLKGSSVRAFITKGDANKFTDVPITAGSVEGKVVAHLPDIGGWLLTLKQPIVVLPIIYIAALLLLTEEVQRMADYLKRCQPYILVGYRVAEKLVNRRLRNTYTGIAMSLVFVVGGLFIWQPALALLKTTPVALAPNNLRVASIAPKCSGNTNNNTSITINNSSTQSASSGSATVGGNTNGSSASSGNASNSSSNQSSITVTNC